MLGEYTSTGGLVQETVWLGDVPVARLRPSGSSVAVYYVEADHLNMPRQVTRASDNKQMWTWFSDPFGTTAANTNPAGAGTSTYDLRFPGQIYDSQAGLQQNYFRDYDPTVGRYVESDPIGLHGGINTYGYVGGNPINRRDPTGRLFGLDDAAAGTVLGAAALVGGGAAFVGTLMGGGSVGDALPPYLLGWWVESRRRLLHQSKLLLWRAPLPMKDSPLQ